MTKFFKEFHSEIINRYREENLKVSRAKRKKSNRMSACRDKDKLEKTS